MFPCLALLSVAPLLQLRAFLRQRAAEMTKEEGSPLQTQLLVRAPSDSLCQYPTLSARAPPSDCCYPSSSLPRAVCSEGLCSSEEECP